MEYNQQIGHKCAYCSKEIRRSTTNGIRLSGFCCSHTRLWVCWLCRDQHYEKLGKKKKSK